MPQRRDLDLPFGHVLRFPVLEKSSAPFETAATRPPQGEDISLMISNALPHPEERSAGTRLEGGTGGSWLAARSRAASSSMTSTARRSSFSSGTGGASPDG
jgi:hypothetical protein